MSQPTSSAKPMSGLLTNAATIAMIFFLLSLLLIATLIVGAGILLVGRILTLIFTVSVFEASLIALSVAMTIVYLVYQITRPQHVLEPMDEDWNDDEDWDEDEEDFADEEDDVIIPPHSRNDPCPCGSGKKYKHCHGKVA